MADPIRILCVFSTLDRGGAENMCMNLYRHIDRKKIQFDFVKHCQEVGAYEEEIASLGGRIFEAPRFTMYNFVSYSIWWKKFLLEHAEYKIIHGHFFTISAIYFRVAKQYGRITIGHIHAASMKSRLKNFLVHKIKYYTDKALACSEMAGKWAYGKEPFLVLKNAIDIESFRFNPSIRSEYRKEFGISDDEFVLGTVANLSSVKNPMGLIDIFESLKKIHPQSRLLWIGEGNQRPIIEERLRKEKIDTSVILLGSRDDVPNLLQAMDAFAFPSFNEGLGIAAVEAQAAGLETFCSNTIPVESKASELCHFLPLNNPKIWAETILRLTINHKRQDMSIQIKNSGYDIHDTAAWLENMYLTLLNEVSS